MAKFPIHAEGRRGIRQLRHRHSLRPGRISAHGYRLRHDRSGASGSAAQRTGRHDHSSRPRAENPLPICGREGRNRKMSSAKFVDEKGEKHQVEILGAGQQFVAYGIHPETGKPYHGPTLTAARSRFQPRACLRLRLNAPKRSSG